jgi:hypothetical protein
VIILAVDQVLSVQELSIGAAAYLRRAAGHGLISGIGKVALSEDFTRFQEKTR